jgi:hypothetical protein
MLLYKPVDMPETCYVQEAAYWLAFGRVPEWFYYEDYARDGRTSVESILDKGPGTEPFDQGFSEMEFKFAGISVDWPRYVEARAISDEPADQYLEWHETQYGNPQPADFLTPDEKAGVVQEFAKFLEEARRNAKELKWAEEMEEGLVPIVDRARAAVFQALSSGELKAFGWVDAKPENEEGRDNIPAEEYGEFVEIPARVWTLRFDWRESKLVTPERTYQVVQVNTADMLKVFPDPTCEPVHFECLAYPGVAMLNDAGEGTPQVSRPRGRPAKAGGHIRSAVQNWFRHQIARGIAPKKKEALVAEAIGFVDTVFKEKISRSAAQAYLEPLMRDVLPEKMPVNAA